MKLLFLYWIWISGLTLLSPDFSQKSTPTSGFTTSLSISKIEVSSELELITSRRRGEFHFNNTLTSLLAIQRDTTKKSQKSELQRKTLTMDEIVVQADRSLQSGHSIQNSSIVNTDAFLEQLTGLTMIKRANFAWEPSLRGMNDARLAVSLDGVTMVGACVDRMDPITSYVETENLEKVQVDKGNQQLRFGNMSGGSVNLVLSQPQMNMGWDGTFSAMHQANGAQKKYYGRIGFSTSQNAFRWSLVYRDSEDILAGDGQRIGLSGYKKFNSKADFVHQVSDNSKIVVTHIADLAQDVGFPALIMDTRRALSHVFSAEYSAISLSQSVSRFSAKAYHTRINHWMDDYDRDVSARTVMPNMFMPMYGYTRTTGLRSEVDLIHENNLLSLNVDVHQFSAFADMLMESTLPNVSDMYLENLPELGFWNGFISGTYSAIRSDRVTFLGSFGVQTSLRNIRNDFGFAQLQGLTPDLKRSMLLAAPTASIGTEIMLSSQSSLSGTLSVGSRLPSHHEAYGYYVYNPLFDVFLFGSPNLRQEKNIQANSTFAWQTQNRHLSIEMSGFWSEYRDYISLRLQDRLFADYANFNNVSMRGGETEIRLSLPRGFSSIHSFSYVWTKNHDENESLPMIPPAEIRSIVEWKHDRLFAQASVRHVWGQNRIARSAVGENSTPSFTIIDLRASFHLSDSFNLNLGIENLTDQWYYEHSSPGQFPSLGRNGYAKIEWNF